MVDTRFPDFSQACSRILKEAPEAAPELVHAVLESEIRGVPKQRVPRVLEASVRLLRLELNTVPGSERENVLRFWDLRSRVQDLAREAAELALEAIEAPMIPREAFDRAEELVESCRELRRNVGELGDRYVDALAFELDEAERSCRCVLSGAQEGGMRQVVDLMERHADEPDGS